MKNLIILIMQEGVHKETFIFKNIKDAWRFLVESDIKLLTPNANQMKGGSVTNHNILGRNAFYKIYNQYTFEDTDGDRYSFKNVIDIIEEV
tara:strand:- start:1511 stop:1783 length:273 start_codon:yes stop_codon:yes gene_type:complete